MSSNSVTILIIHAPNVHQGGGAALLLPLLSLITEDCHCIAILDRRFQLPNKLYEQIEVIPVEPTVRSRIEAERKLAGLARPQDVILCFGNLPPLFKLSARVFVFVQNRLLLEPASLGAFPWKVRMRIFIERCWLRLRASSVTQFFVQTPSMQRSLEQRFAVRAVLFPFVRDSQRDYPRRLPVSDGEASTEFDFLYVASGEPHKNHRNLIMAWQLLAEDGLRPVLCLTIEHDAEKELMAWIDDMKTRHDLKINNVSSSSQAEIDTLYSRVKALIYPSRCESLGLPLIEARNAGLPVLASELDFVRDVIDPEQTFDPESPVSIARAVKRFMGAEEQPLPLKSAGDFVQYLLKQDP